jgi:HTH-type transcriptional regulator/antitoxin HigA
MVIGSLIRNETEYEAAIAEIERLWGAETGTPDGDHLSLLALLVSDYDGKHHRIEPPDPIEAILERMDDLGLSRTDLGTILGATSGRVSEILNKRRALSIDMIRKLTAALGLSEHCLLQDYELERQLA